MKVGSDPRPCELVTRARLDERPPSGCVSIEYVEKFDLEQRNCNWLPNSAIEENHRSILALVVCYESPASDVITGSYCYLDTASVRDPMAALRFAAARAVSELNDRSWPVSANRSHRLSGLDRVKANARFVPEGDFRNGNDPARFIQYSGHCALRSRCRENPTYEAS